ncbi:MAG: prepilin peptidase, partial [Candidatus Heimdallarchaeota archaeon]|nr:prepilin peptidase [Candidatus Heimdallarchaeota archaeon]
NLGDSVPLHFTAFHPDFRMRDKEMTPAKTLIRARKIAMGMGLIYVYLGNVHNVEGQTTYCPNCKAKLIKRNWHSVISYNIVNGKCQNCGEKIEGVFTF